MSDPVPLWASPKHVGVIGDALRVRRETLDDGWSGPPAAAEALKGELYRVPSSQATRTYLNEVLRALMRLPEDLACETLGSLADDRSLSVRWRRRFEEAAWRLGCA